MYTWWDWIPFWICTGFLIVFVSYICVRCIESSVTGVEGTMGVRHFSHRAGKWQPVCNDPHTRFRATMDPKRVTCAKCKEIIKMMNSLKWPEGMNDEEV